MEENLVLETNTVFVEKENPVNASQSVNGIIDNIFNSFEIICIVVVCISLLIMFFKKNEKYKKIAIIFLGLAILGLLFLLVLKVQAAPQVIVS